MSPEKTKTNPLGSGRNPRIAGEQSSPTAIRLTPSERERYAEAAAAAGLSLGEWIRAACGTYVSLNLPSDVIARAVIGVPPTKQEIDAARRKLADRIADAGLARSKKTPKKGGR